jgi:hypothetical protein
MIQGFETRDNSDKVIRAFVKSANGILHTKLNQLVNMNKQNGHPIIIYKKNL